MLHGALRPSFSEVRSNRYASIRGLVYKPGGVFNISKGVNIEHKYDPPQQHRHNNTPPDYESRHIPLVKLLIDERTQTRVALDQEAVESYAELMAEDGPPILPPIQVFEEAEVGFWVGDGFHRIAAAAKAGSTDILAFVRRGTRLDALVHSLKSNHTYGVRRTNADKRRGVELVFREESLRGESDRAIAQLCGVGNQLVGDVRRDLKLADTGQVCDSHSSPPPAKRKGLDGKLRSAVGHRRGKKTRPPVEASSEAQSPAKLANCAMPAFPNGSGKHDAVEDEPSTTKSKQAEYTGNAESEASGLTSRNPVNILANGTASPLTGDDDSSEKEEKTPTMVDHEGFLLVDGSRLSSTQWDDGPVPLDWTQGEIDNLKRNNDQLTVEKRRDILTLQTEQICMVELVRTANRLLMTLNSAAEPLMAILNSAVFRLRNYTATRSMRVSNTHQNESARH